jgi:hypothetical protein
MTMHTKDDYFEAGKPIHKTSYCAFLDVLGFSERIKDSFKEKKGNRLLRTFHTILSKRIKALKADTSDSLLYFKSFTDNIIFAHPRFSDDMESEFGFILLALSEYQFDMAQHGFFIRGGLSVGDLFVDENSVYGPALLEAYHLESKVAVNPAVVLSDDVMGLVLSHLKFYHGDFAPQNRAVLVNSDGRFFINYLAECIVDGHDSEEVAWSALRTHKKHVEAALKEYQQVPAIFAKFAWLASYHNCFCDSVSNYPGYKDTVRVSKKLASIQFRRLKDVWPPAKRKSAVRKRSPAT